ncbi:MAG: RdgB/HAM1 family non-canonical purine NTP pyrophosphatase [Cyclobacteriaceae bacterium]|nr:RdgB/HAM1 family non-canonical purine NTP pyrophosphatase [Cyclobacteriaceae bacterium]
MTLCFATNNPNKVKEIQALLGDAFSLQSLAQIGCTETLAEDQDTIAGNSLQKAQYVFDTYHVPCFADDTGLEVTALGGAPGVYSARYAGPQCNADDNIARLLHELEGKADKSARFRTVITLITQAGMHQFEGVLAGSILPEKKGTNGFGYDPVFVPEGTTETLAEMELQKKNLISHRALAFRKLERFLKQRA